MHMISLLAAAPLMSQLKLMPATGTSPEVSTKRLWILKSRLLEVIGIPLSSRTILHSELGLENQSLKTGTSSLSSASANQTGTEHSSSSTAPLNVPDWNMNIFKRPLSCVIR